MIVDSNMIINLGKLSQIEACIQYPDLARQLDKSGIYAIKLRNEVIYVGESRILFFRLINHCNKLQAKRLSKTDSDKKYRYLRNHLDNITFEVLEVTHNLKKQEKYYIQKYNPIFNILSPDGLRYFNGTMDDVSDFVCGLATMDDLRQMLDKKPK